MTIANANIICENGGQIPPIQFFLNDQEEGVQVVIIITGTGVKGGCVCEIHDATAAVNENRPTDPKTDGLASSRNAETCELLDMLIELYQSADRAHKGKNKSNMKELAKTMYKMKLMLEAKGVV